MPRRPTQIHVHTTFTTVGDLAAPGIQHMQFDVHHVQDHGVIEDSFGFERIMKIYLDLIPVSRCRQDLAVQLRRLSYNGPGNKL